MSLSSIKALIAIAILTALVSGGYAAGVHVTNNAWEAKVAKERDEANQRYRAEVDRADKASSAYLNEHRNQEDRYEALNDEFKAYRQRRIPLVGPAAAQAAAAPAAGASGSQDGDRKAAAPGRVDVPDAEPVLRLGAVWMWNSALAGRDVPAGACDAAAAAGGPEAAACAEISGISLQDAFDNHTDNARSCARDRQRYQSLIDYLTKRKGAP